MFRAYNNTIGSFCAISSMMPSIKSKNIGHMQLKSKPICIKDRDGIYR